MTITSHSNTPLLPPSGPAPGVHPQAHGHPDGNRHGPKGGGVATCAVAQDVVDVLFARPQIQIRVVGAPLVDESVDGAPQGGAGGGGHGQNAPVCAKVLDAPDYADDNRGQGEDGAVACADEAGDEGEARGVVLDRARGEEQLSQREEEGKGEQEGDSADGEAASGLRRERGEAVGDAVGALQVRAWRGGGGEDVAQCAGDEAGEG